MLYDYNTYQRKAGTSKLYRDFNTEGSLVIVDPKVERWRYRIFLFNCL